MSTESKFYRYQQEFTNMWQIVFGIYYYRPDIILPSEASKFPPAIDGNARSACAQLSDIRGVHRILNLVQEAPYLQQLYMLNLVTRTMVVASTRARPRTRIIFLFFPCAARARAARARRPGI